MENFQYVHRINQGSIRLLKLLKVQLFLIIQIFYQIFLTYLFFLVDNFLK